VTVVVGPSGSGKSTLLRLCNRLEAPSSGTVRFHGADVAGLEPLRLRRRVGMVFQRPTPFAGTVRDNLRIARPDVADEDAKEALERADLAQARRLADFVLVLTGGRIEFIGAADEAASREFLDEQ